jgi:hypothetical protein
MGIYSTPVRPMDIELRVSGADGFFIWLAGSASEHSVISGDKYNWTLPPHFSSKLPHS